MNKNKFFKQIFISKNSKKVYLYLNEKQSCWFSKALNTKYFIQFCLKANLKTFDSIFLPFKINKTTFQLNPHVLHNSLQTRFLR